MDTGGSAVLLSHNQQQQLSKIDIKNTWHHHQYQPINIIMMKNAIVPVNKRYSERNYFLL